MAAITVACIITAYNGRDELRRLLDSLALQTVQLDVYIVDSGSTDGTAELAEFRCTNVLRVLHGDFKAGETRQVMVERSGEYDIYVFMDHTACLPDPEDLERLLAPFLDERVGASCGRQIPYARAGARAEFALAQAYPATSRTMTQADFSQSLPPGSGEKLLMSLAFCAFRGKALAQVGGFPRHLVTGEGLFVAAKMLLKNWHIAYVGETHCRNKIGLSGILRMRQVFERILLLRQEPLLKTVFGCRDDVPFAGLQEELRFLSARRFWLWPAAVVAYGLARCGYWLSRRKKLPVRLRRWLSPHVDPAMSGSKS